MASKVKMSSDLLQGVDRLKEEHIKVINNQLSFVCVHARACACVSRSTQVWRYYLHVNVT